MQTLQAGLDEFINWARRMAVAGFMDYATDTYHDLDQYTTVAEELEQIGSEMRDAVQLGMHEYFIEARSNYQHLFEETNRNLCRHRYDEMVAALIENMKMSRLDAETAALEHMWSDPKVRYWLPIFAQLTDKKGREVHLVAKEEFAPKGKCYVTISELNEIKGTGKDPWSFVKRRSA